MASDPTSLSQSAVGQARGRRLDFAIGALAALAGAAAVEALLASGVKILNPMLIPVVGALLAAALRGLPAAGGGYLLALGYLLLHFVHPRGHADYFSDTVNVGITIALSAAIVLAAGWTGEKALRARVLQLKMAGEVARLQAREEYEIALRESEERLDFALRMSQIGAWQLDLADHSAHRTPLHDRIFGYEALLPEWSYEKFLEHVLAEDRAEVERRFQAAIASQSDWNFECRIRRADGEVRWIWAAGGHGLNAVTQTPRLSGIVQDITGRKRTEEQLAALNAELETKIASRTAELAKALEESRAADRVKSEFLASMSHELRTPLNAVIGFTDALLAGVHGPLPEAVRGDLGEILAAGDTLLAELNGLIDLARIEGGRLELLRSEADAAMLLEASACAHRRAAKAKGIALECKPPPELRFECDPGRVRQMIDQLLSNALKFTPPGGRVACRARTVPRAEVNGAIPAAAPAAESYVEIAIEDSGPGIASADQARLFQPFVQIDRALTRTHGGAGLGLALASRLAGLHGGAAGVDSAPGRGSTFYLWLPR